MFTKKNLIIGGVVVVVLCAIGVAQWRTSTGDEATEATLLPVATMTTAGEFSGQTTVSLIGTVRAFSEAAITAEQPGRVTSVPVQLGQTVQAGQIIVTLENASQQAAVLQAEGTYEAALAAAAQNDVGISEAETQLQSAKSGALTTYQNAYGTVNNVILTTTDQFFSQPNSTRPGLRIDGRGLTETLNSERIAYQTILRDWEATSRSINPESDLTTLLTEADATTARTLRLLDTFITVFNSQSTGANSRYTEEELQLFINEFSTTRSTLVEIQSSIASAETQLNAAQEALERATLAGSGGQISAADAQVKQALGSLRAAQANLAKTIIRAPISGTVNSLSVRTGDFIGAQQQVAEVANNDALEIVTAIGEQERDVFAIGDTVQVEGDLDGRVTEIAPAVAASTGKIEVRIAAESTTLKNGDTVTITRQATTSIDSRVFVPLAAVKFKQSDGVVFLVENGTLVDRPVTLGVVRGGSVEILDGLTNTEQFVTDARGLQAGTAVEITK